MNLNTPTGVVCFESIFTTNRFRDKDWNSVELVFPDPKVLDEFKTKVKAHVAEKLNGKIPVNFRWPWRKCEERINSKTGDRYAGYPDGGEFLRVKRDASNPKLGRLKPEVIRNEKNEPATPDDIYAGCLGRVHCYAHVYAGVDGGPPGVTLCLEGFQKKGEGERIGRGPVSSSVFDDDLNI